MFRSRKVLIRTNGRTIEFDTKGRKTLTLEPHELTDALLAIYDSGYGKHVKLSNEGKRTILTPVRRFW